MGSRKKEARRVSSSWWTEFRLDWPADVKERYLPNTTPPALGLRGVESSGFGVLGSRFSVGAWGLRLGGWGLGLGDGFHGYLTKGLGCDSLWA